MQDEVTAALRQGIADLDEDGVLATVRANLAAGADPAAIIAACEEGMRLVGEHYEQGEYFLSGLIMAGEIFREVLDLTRPALEAALAGDASGRVLPGTVKGDIHDIGKAILQIALRANGFAVEDLGVDVSPEAFVAKTLTWRPNIIGLSGLLTTAYEPMRETVRLLRAQPNLVTPPIPIIIGGGTLNEQVRAFTGADYWCNDALEGVRLCQRIMALRGTDTAGPGRGLVV
jgi:methanogenic corrinoid protein MtbC1